jgi:hypothetical protein
MEHHYPPPVTTCLGRFGQALSRHPGLGYWLGLALWLAGLAAHAQTTWTARTSAADNQWYSVTYGNGQFVAVSASGTGNRVMTSVASPLPVSLVAFAATPTPQHTVELAWTTSLEANNKGFQIERSKDLVHFETVGQQGPAGEANSQALKHYQLTDLTPYRGTSYYRLTQIDLSGKTTVYPAVSVVLRDNAYGVYPNPVTGDERFTLRLDEPETATVGFYHADGRSLPLQKAGVESGNLVLKPMGKLSTGVYVLRVEERGQTRQHRILIE